MYIIHIKLIAPERIFSFTIELGANSFNYYTKHRKCTGISVTYTHEDMFLLKALACGRVEHPDDLEDYEIKGVSSGDDVS